VIHREIEPWLDLVFRLLLLNAGADERRMIDRGASFDIRFLRILLQTPGDRTGEAWLAWPDHTLVITPRLTVKGLTCRSSKGHGASASRLRWALQRKVGLIS
jgi:hypothetical protein